MESNKIASKILSYGVIETVIINKNNVYFITNPNRIRVETSKLFETDLNGKNLIVDGRLFKLVLQLISKGEKGKAIIVDDMLVFETEDGNNIKIPLLDLTENKSKEELEIEEILNQKDGIKVDINLKDLLFNLNYISTKNINEITKIVSLGIKDGKVVYIRTTDTFAMAESGDVKEEVDVVVNLDGLELNKLTKFSNVIDENVEENNEKDFDEQVNEGVNLKGDEVITIVFSKDYKHCYLDNGDIKAIATIVDIDYPNIDFSESELKGKAVFKDTNKLKEIISFTSNGNNSEIKVSFDKDTTLIEKYLEKENVKMKFNTTAENEIESGLFEGKDLYINSNYITKLLSSFRIDNELKFELKNFNNNIIFYWTDKNGHKLYFTVVLIDKII